MDMSKRIAYRRMTMATCGLRPSMCAINGCVLPKNAKEKTGKARMRVEDAVCPDITRLAASAALERVRSTILQAVWCAAS